MLEGARTRKAKQTAAVEDEALGEALRAVWDDLGLLTGHPELLSGLPAEERRELYELCIERVLVYPNGHQPRVEITFRF